MNHFTCKRTINRSATLGIYLLLTLFTGGFFSMQSCLAKSETEEFNSLRLPFGSPETRLDLVKVNLNEIFGSREKRPLASDEFFREIAKSDIILVGEGHTCEEHHLVQKRIIEGLYKTGHNVVLALEMFNHSQNKALEEYVMGSYTTEEFVDRTDWFKAWGHNFRYYQPIFEFSRDCRIPMFGVNIPHELISKARKSGISSLSEMEQQLVSKPDTDNSEHRYFVNAMMQGIGAQSPEVFSGIYLAQCMWDAAMGEGAIKLAERFPGAKIVILVGTGHVAYNLGIARIIGARSSFRPVSVLPVDIPVKIDDEKGKSPEKGGEKGDIKRQFSVHMGPGSDKPEVPHSIVSRGAADFFIGVPAENHEKYPALGLNLKDTPEGIKVSMIFPETMAEKKGFKSGDLIIKVNGKSFPGAIDLKKWLASLGWQDQVDFLISRESGTTRLKFLLDAKNRKSQ